MIRLFLFLVTVFLTSTLSFGQQFTDLSKDVPFDASIRHGVLPNGLTYYIKHNGKPEGRASFYIYQNVGAVLETDEQDGLAHFLEHMAFNGTNTFPGKSMLDMLERNGVKFGKDINAYTTANETVYNLSKVPTAPVGLVDSCLMILHDWCDGLALTEEEIDAERGVITEEWRTRRNAAFRVNAQVRPVLTNGSVYAERDVIGELDVIKNFDPEVLRKFYHDWYRTDLQAISIVGDIDADTVEKKVIALFSPIPAVENPKERTEVVIPENKEPLYVAATEKEYKNVTVSMTMRHPDTTGNTLADLREPYIIGFFNSLMKARFAERTQMGDAPFLAGSVNYGGFLRGYNSFSVTAKARPGEEAEAFEAVYSMLQQVINEGFTQTELDRLKKNKLVAVQNSYNKRDQISSDSYAKALKNVYLSHISLSDPEFKYQFANEIIPTITLDEVSAVASKYLTDENRVYTVSGPEKKGVSLITKKAIESIIAKVQDKHFEPYVDNIFPDTELLGTNPEGGEIVSEKPLEQFDAVEWTLSNGAKVVYRFADYQKESVALKGLSYGGTSLYDVNDLPSLGAAYSFVKTFGIGDYNPTEFKKVTTGKSVGCSFGIGGYTESVLAYSTPNDIETMLQLVYMRFEEPRFDREKYDNLLERSYLGLKNEVKSVGTIMKDTINTLVDNGNPRSLKYDANYLDAMDFDRMKEIYHERFSNASDFVFFIVGNIDVETLKPLVEKYIGSIESDGTTEKWVDNGDYFPKGKNEYRIAVPMVGKATFVMKMKADAAYSRKTVIYHEILKSILDLRYTENIREKEGGTYGVGVKSGASRIPQMKLSMDIKFDCDPNRVDYLKSLIYKELDEVQHNVLQTDLDKVVLNMKKNSEHRTENNSYWMGALQTWYDTGENVLDPGYFDEVLDQVTTKDIEKAARDFLKDADVMDFVFLPEQNI